MPSNATTIHTWPWAFYVDLLSLSPIVLLGLYCAFFQQFRFHGEISLVLVALAIGISVSQARHPIFSTNVGLLLWGGIAWSALVCRDRVTRRATRTPEEDLKLSEKIGAILLLPIVSSLSLWGRDLIAGAKLDGWKQVFSEISLYRNPHPFGHWNYTGAYALLVLPWLIMLAVSHRGKQRIAWATAASLTFIVLISAFSRGAVLGLATTLVFAVGMQVLGGQVSKAQRNLLIVGGVTIATLLLIGNPRLRDFILHPQTVREPNEGDIQRIGMLQGGWMLFKQHPFIGYGPGMTPFVFPEVRGKVVGGVETSFQLHNSVLQIAVDHGFFGIAALIGCTVFLVLGARGYLNKSITFLLIHEKRFGMASMYTLVGYSVVALTDYQFNVPAIVAVVGFHSGILLGGVSLEDKSIDTSSIGQRMFGWTCLALSITMTIVIFPEWKARHCFWMAWWTTPENDRQTLLVRLHDAADASPTNPFYRTMLGLQLAREADTIHTPQGSADLLKLAGEELTLSLRVDAAQEPVESGLGWIALRSSPENAIPHFRQALRLIPDRDTLHLGLAFSQIAMSNENSAVRDLALECLVNPSFVTSPLWDELPLSSLQTKVHNELDEIIQSLLNGSEVPSWRKPQIEYLRAWVKWWQIGYLPEPKALLKATPQQQHFFEWVRKLEIIPTAPPPSDLNWKTRTLAQVYNSPENLQNDLQACPLPLSTPAVDGALIRLKQKPASFCELLRKRTTARVGLVSENISRLHYNIMARNLDGPGIPDLCTRPNDRFIQEFVEFTIPPKALVPGDVLKMFEESNLKPQ